MLLIAHRGNLTGKNTDKENTIAYISRALDDNYYVEIDIRFINDKWVLGHDTIQEEVSEEFLNNEKLFVHAKNTEALLYLKKLNLDCEYFWHDTDDYTLTSKQTVWVYPNKQLLAESICVMPELGYSGSLAECKGICSDIISTFRV